MATIMNENERFHLKIKKGDVGKYVILPGDPGRVPIIAEYLDDAIQVAQNREYNIYTGKLHGKKVSVCSTGIGGPSAAIAVEELIESGATTFIRVGTCGGVALQVLGGDLIIAEAAIRAEGTSYEYLPQGYPALADFEVTSALAQAAKEIYENKNVFGNYYVGVVQSTDSFYGAMNPEGSAVAEHLNARRESYLKSDCLAFEMGCAAIYSVGIVRKAEHKIPGIRCGAALIAGGNAERVKRGLEEMISNDTTKDIKCAVRALEIIIANDAEWEARYRAWMNENR